jgi:hypothetical protein
MLRGDRYALLPLALTLPSIAAAHFQRRDGISAPLDGLREVEQFATTSYLSHLVSGHRSSVEIETSWRVTPVFPRRRSNAAVVA